MDAIKKKMQSLKTETENAMARADQLESKLESSKTEVRDYHVFDPSVQTHKGHFIG